MTPHVLSFNLTCFFKLLFIDCDIWYILGTYDDDYETTEIGGVLQIFK